MDPHRPPPISILKSLRTFDKYVHGIIDRRDSSTP
jgi:hypothetical protein